MKAQFEAAEVKARFEAYLAPIGLYLYWTSLTLQNQKDLVRSIVGCVQEQEAALRSAKIQAYCVASGHTVSIRLKCRTGTRRLQKVVPRKGAPTVSEVVLACTPHFKVVPNGEAYAALHAAARWFSVLELESALGDELRIKIDEALAALPTAQKAKALQQAEANRHNTRLRQRQAALERLAETMRTWEYGESDVMEAWRMSQVERVQQS